MENEKSMEAKLNEAQKREADKKLEIKRTVLFVLFVFVVTYGTEIFMVMPLVGSADTDQAMAAQTILSSVMFIPTFGAILIRWITKERLTVTNLMLSLKIKENLKYYGLAWLGTAALIIFGAVFYYLLSPGRFDSELGYVNLILTEQAKQTGEQITKEIVQRAVLFQVVIGVVMSPFANLLNCFGEEWGFRGYLLPKMMKHLRRCLRFC